MALSQYWCFRVFLLLPTVLGILSSILFYTEKANGTQKNISTVPVSPASLIIAKVITVLIFSVVYSLATNGATLIGGLIIGNVNHVVNRLFMGILISLMVAISILPIIAIVSLSKKGYVFQLLFRLYMQAPVLLLYSQCRMSCHLCLLF